MDTDALALIARFTTPPSLARTVLINSIIKNEKAGGRWSNYDGFYFWAGEDSQSSLLDWTPNLRNATVVGAPTFTANRGWTGTGTATNRLSTPFNPSTAGGKMTATSAHLAFYCLSASPNGGLIGWNGDGTFGIFVSGSVLGRVFDSDATAQPLGASHYLASRTGATARSFYKDGVGTATATAGASMPNGVVTILEATTSFSSSQAAFSSFGSGFTDADAAGQRANIRAALVSVGAITS